MVHVFFCLLLFWSTPKEQSVPFLSEKIFIEKESLHSLKGTLYLPLDGKPQKIVIFLVSIRYEIEEKFELTNDPLLMQYIQSLLSDKVGVLLLNRGEYNIFNKNKSQRDIEIEALLEHSIETAAYDAETALIYLKSDIKYSKIPVGIMGISETGCAAAIAVSKSKKADFAVLISTPGIKGVEEHKYDKENLHSHWIKAAMFSETLSDSIYFYEKEKFVKKNDGFDSVFYANFYNIVVDIEHQIILKYENYDSITYYANKLFYEKWNGTVFKPKLRKLGEEQSLDSYINSIINILFTPRYIAFSRWNPDSCFPDIKCPVLMLYGRKDININLNSGVDNVKKIVADYQLNNFSLKCYEGLDHTLFLDKGIKPNERKNILQNEFIPDYVLLDIREWMDLMLFGYQEWTMQGLQLKLR